MSSLSLRQTPRTSELEVSQCRIMPWTLECRLQLLLVEVMTCIPAFLHVEAGPEQST